MSSFTSGLPKIELYDEDHALQDSYTFAKIDLRQPASIEPDPVLDTEEPLAMENGDVFAPQRGVYAVIKINYVYYENVSLAALDTFLDKLDDWDGDIRCSPYNDGNIYWVRKVNMTKNVMNRFVGYEGEINFRGTELLGSL